MGVFERGAELGAAAGKIGGQRVRVGGVNESVPPQKGMALEVGHRNDAALGLDQDLRAFAADDGEEGTLGRSRVSRLETQRVAVEGDRPPNVADDPEGEIAWMAAISYPGCSVGRREVVVERELQ